MVEHHYGGGVCKTVCRGSSQSLQLGYHFEEKIVI